MRHYFKSCFIGVFACLLCHAASAVPVGIDRTSRTIDIPAECQDNGATYSNINFNAGGVVLNGIDTRFTLTLSTTALLRTRAYPTAVGNELAWFHFVNSNGNADRDAGLDNQRKLRRAYILARCGLPWVPNDQRLYQFPANLNQFIAFVMGAGGADPRLPSGYSIVGNGEREAILMYAAQRIKMVLTPTIVARDQVCLLYGNAESRSGCVDAAAAPPGDVILGYLYEGMNRVSYTGHEFWMMYSNPVFRNKVHFTSGTVLVNGNNVDNFLDWNGVHNDFVMWNDPAGNLTTFSPAPFRFQSIVDVNNNNRDFYQTVMPAFQTRFDQHVMTYKKW